jgi:hypothetical protein
MKIIVLTPIKNEVWILERFLAVCSQFADHILIADQNSTDGSKSIYPRYPKVTVIENKNASYDEASRQKLLIDNARELFPGPKLFLALDADEILAANAIHTQGWKTMLSAEPGTVLYFEKPDLLLNPYQCIRFKNSLWPLGFVDDGSEHQATKIHSIRIPVGKSNKLLYLHDVIILHYAAVRPACQRAKFRLYSVIENANNINNFIKRRYRYGVRNFLKYDSSPEACPMEWFEGWEDKGIDMKSINHEKHYWNDIEILKYFKKYGYKKFWTDDIWDKDWEGIRIDMSAKIPDEIPAIPVEYPGKIHKGITNVLDRLFSFYKKI